jgi:hypothetical protein
LLFLPEPQPLQIGEGHSPPRQEHQGMRKPSYPRNEGRVLDVEMMTPGSPLRIVNCFNREEDAWQWVDQQRQADRFARRLKRNPEGRGRA